MNLPSVILILAIITGQLIKLPILNLGVTILDLTVIFLNIYGLWKIRFHLKKTPIWVYGALIFIVVAIISLIFTPLNLEPTQKLTAFSYTLRLISFILLGWLIYSGAYPVLKENIAKVFMVSGVGLATLGILQLIFIPDLHFMALRGWDPHYFRAVSSFFDPNFLGVYLVLTLLLLYRHSREDPDEYYSSRIPVYRGGNPFNKFITWITAIQVRDDKIVFTVVYLSLLTTFSRGSYLMFFASFVMLTILNRSIRLGILTIVLSLGLFFGFLSYDKIIAQPRNIDRVQSAEYRLNSWQQGIMMFQENPLLGVGYNAYRYGLEQFGLASKDFTNSRGASSNDSSLLFIAATTGIIGIAAYCFFLGTLLWTNRKNYIFISGLAGLIIASFFINTLFYPFILVWIVLNAVSKKTE